MTRIALRPAPALLVVALVLLLAAACTSSGPSPAPPAASSAPVAAERLDASVAQFRFDEGTRNLKAGVTNGSDRDIRVTEATIDWAAMAFPTVRIADPLTRPGQTAAFTIRYGAPRCAVSSSGRPTLVAVLDGQRRRLPLRVEDPGLLRRLRAKACAGQRLDAVAGVTLRLEPRTVRVGRAEYVPGAVLLRRRAGATGAVRLVDLGGSVLLDLVPRDGPSALPGRLGPRSAETAFPVLLGSAHRCDAHARGQSSQTFLISAYVRLDDAPTQRVVLPVTSAERDRLLRVIDRDCGTPDDS